MKKYNSVLKYILVMITAFLLQAVYMTINMMILILQGMSVKQQVIILTLKMVLQNGHYMT